MKTTPRAHWALSLLLSLAACTRSDPSPADAAVDVAATDIAVDAPGDVAAAPDSAYPPPNDSGTVVTLPEGDCDPLDEHHCAFPWPSNLYLRADATRATGYALTFGATSLPANTAEANIDPRRFRHLDGYGVGTPIMVQFPNLDVSTMAGENTMERSMAADAAAVLYEVQGTTLRRVPYFVELDRQERDVAQQILFMRPGVILKENTRYVVAFRGLRDTAGRAIEPSRAFARLRDGMTAGDTALAPRQARFDEVFRLLEGQGVTRASLTLAWDFHTASSAALHGRMLAIRDDMLQRVGPMGPELHVDEVRTFSRTMGATDYDPNIAMELVGTFEVPHYMHTFRVGASQGWEMNLDAMGRPFAQGTRTAKFWVRIPHAAVNGPPQGLVMYGHGLLGEGDEVEAGYNSDIANQNNLIFFAANMTGMSSEDLPSVFATLTDASNFSSVADRLHQGMAEWVVLARAMRARLATIPAVMQRNVRVNPDELFYSGISQGGVFGGTFVALSPDITRAHLGVPGNNYITLLHRSTDFVLYFQTLRRYYPNTADQAMGLACVQLLWDSSDSVSYLRHLSQAPFANTPSHQVLLAPAKGDHQVSPLTDEIAARSDLGIAVMANYDRDRTPYGVTLAPYPRMGSALVLYDFGNAWPAPGNVPPTDSMDPHGLPRRLAAHQRQMVHFFRTGEVIDVCGGDGCHPD